MGKRFRLITNREKIIRIRIDRLVEDYKKSSSHLKNDAERKAAARRVVNRREKHVRPLCNICFEKVHVVTIDRGRKTIEKEFGIPRFIPRFLHVGHWCDTCLHFFYVTPPLNREECEHRKRKITIDRSKVISLEAGIPRFDQIGLWCDECRRFDQTKIRKIIIGGKPE